MTYGAPRVHADLRAAGVCCPGKRVASLMRENRLARRFPKRFRRTTVSHPFTALPDLVQRDFSPSEPDQLWVTDITYVRTGQGWLYLAVVLDCFSRRVVGWAMRDNLGTELVLQAMRMALLQRTPRPGLVHHSDRGCQYTSDAYEKLLGAHDVLQSVSRPGDCYDNAVAESFFAPSRRSWCTGPPGRRASGRGWPSSSTSRPSTNRERRHSVLGNVSPEEFEASHRARQAASSECPPKGVKPMRATACIRVLASLRIPPHREVVILCAARVRKTEYVPKLVRGHVLEVGPVRSRVHGAGLRLSRGTWPLVPIRAELQLDVPGQVGVAAATRRVKVGVPDLCGRRKSDDAVESWLVGCRPIIESRTDV